MNDGVNDDMNRLDEIAERLEAEPDGPDLCPVSECETCAVVRDARAMLAVVCDVAGLAEGLDDWPAVGANNEEQHQIDTEKSIARDLWKILAPLTGTHTEET